MGSFSSLNSNRVFENLDIFRVDVKSYDCQVMEQFLRISHPKIGNKIGPLVMYFSNCKLQSYFSTSSELSTNIHWKRWTSKEKNIWFVQSFQNERHSYQIQLQVCNFLIPTLCRLVQVEFWEAYFVRTEVANVLGSWIPNERTAWYGIKDCIINFLGIWDITKLN